MAGERIPFMDWSEFTEGANLGLATTRELLREVEARLATEDGSLCGYPGQVALRLQDACGIGLIRLPDRLLEYRTVDS